jgi:hypothetical protein
MKYYLLLTLITFIYGCSSQRQTLVFIKHTPYCGGARPTPEMARGTTVMAAKSKFALTKKGEKTVEKWITTDTSGTWAGKLNAGNYDVYRADKFLNSEVLKVQMNSFIIDTTNYRFVGEKCIELWKNEPDYSFTVSNSGSIHIELKGKCFVGFTPCIEYIGPKVQ